MKKYYIDTSIWMDFYEDRKDYNNEPLGDFAFRLFSLIKTKKYKLVISDMLLKELEINYTISEINGMINPFENISEKILTNKKQRDEANQLARERNIPYGDALHAIIARDNKCVLITRDNDFKKLKDVSNYYKPEDIT